MKVFSVVCLSLLPTGLLLASPNLQEIVRERVDGELAGLVALYEHFHAHPELSLQEEQSARRLAAEFREAGLEVTEGVGGFGVVGVLKNGAGPTVLVRGDMDALPVREQTGLPYASTVRATDNDGNEVPVMHACGHDVHMTAVAGAARVLADLREHWQGTLVVIGQPAEEIVAGARAMLEDGLFTRFPLPDYAIALHVSPEMPVGTVGYTSGYSMANVDSVDIVIRGVGGHGAYPHTTKDPIVLAAQTVLALQTIVSREVSPLDPAVLTVGAINGGTKHNIIPEEVELQLTVRSYTDEVRTKILQAIERIARGIAAAAGVPEDRMPIVTVSDTSTPAVYNDPDLTGRLVATFSDWLGPENVLEREPVMGAEDFAHYGRTEHNIPALLYRLGTVDVEEFREAKAAGRQLPSVHSPFYAPDAEPSVRMGVTTLVAAVLNLMKDE